MFQNMLKSIAATSACILVSVFAIALRNYTRKHAVG
jgi:hypothetical protein